MRRIPILVLAVSSFLLSLAPAAAVKPKSDLPESPGAAFAAPATGAKAALVNLREPAAGGDFETMARSVLARHAAALGLASDADLELQSVRRGKAIDVVRFRQRAAGLPVLRGGIAVSFNRGGEAIFVASDLRPVLGDRGALAAAAGASHLAREAARGVAIARLGASGAYNVDRTTLEIFPGADGARVVWVSRLAPQGEPVGDWEVLVDAASGEVLRVEDRALYDDGQGQAFLPDPLSSAGATYGDTGFVDGSDANTTQLTGEIFEVTLRDLTFSGSYSLKGPYADCQGTLESPSVACTTSADTDFRLVPASRESDLFEEMNVYYHLDTFLRYINETLGIPVLPFQYVGGVKFDPHGLSGADNSHYTSAGILAFGDGGVDDSEDADVVIHELGHGIHDWVTNGNLSQTDGLSEGVGDYFAVSYSRTFGGQWTPGDAQYNWVFSWDGHNPFWAGRLTNWNDGHLYTPGMGGLHTTGQFWASCNIDIAEIIGYDVVDEAMIEGLSMTGSTANHAVAAQAVMQAAAELGYGAATLATMAGIYNTNSGSAGCNYSVTIPGGPIFSDDFERGNASRWSLVSGPLQPSL